MHPTSHPQALLLCFGYKDLRNLSWVPNLIPIIKNCSLIPPKKLRGPSSILVFE